MVTYISPISPLYLPYISPISPLYLPLYLPYLPGALLPASVYGVAKAAMGASTLF